VDTAGLGSRRGFRWWANFVSTERPLCILTATRLLEYVPEGAIVAIPVAPPDTDQMVDVIFEVGVC
jgi:hypothetical protein